MEQRWPTCVVCSDQTGSIWKQLMLTANADTGPLNQVRQPIYQSQTDTQLPEQPSRGNSHVTVSLCSRDTSSHTSLTYTVSDEELICQQLLHKRVTLTSGPQTPASPYAHSHKGPPLPQSPPRRLTLANTELQACGSCPKL